MAGEKKKVEVLGPGCYRCQALAENVQKAAAELGIDLDLHKVTDINAITKYGVFMTPALVVDGQVKCSGKVPSVEEIKSML